MNEKHTLSDDDLSKVNGGFDYTEGSTPPGAIIFGENGNPQASRATCNNLNWNGNTEGYNGGHICQHCYHLQTCAMKDGSVSPCCTCSSNLKRFY